MSFKTLFAAAALSTLAVTAALAQTAPTQQQNNPLRPTTPTQTPAPAAPAAPAAQRPAQAQPAPQAQQPAAQRPAATQNRAVNLNTATKAELETLTQIGPARADAIIAKRPYRDWNDFVAKDVVPKNAEAAIKDNVRFR
jgi:competence protein ComEA